MARLRVSGFHNPLILIRAFLLYRAFYTVAWAGTFSWAAGYKNFFDIVRGKGEYKAAKEMVKILAQLSWFFKLRKKLERGYEETLDYFDSIGEVDQVIGLHIWSTLPKGEILLIPDSVLSGGTGFTCKIKGTG